jgi:hypothetical protein
MDTSPPAGRATEQRLQIESEANKGRIRRGERESMAECAVVVYTEPHTASVRISCVVQGSRGLTRSPPSRKREFGCAAPIRELHGAEWFGSRMKWVQEAAELRSRRCAGKW